MTVARVDHYQERRALPWPAPAGFFLAVLLPAVAPADDWLQYRGLDRNGVWSAPVSYGLASRDDTTVRGGEVSELTVVERWRRRIGAGYSGTAIVGGRLFTMVSDGKGDHAVALDAASGKELWRVSQQVVNPGAVNNVAPVVSDGKILVRNQEEMVALVHIATD